MFASFTTSGRLQLPHYTLILQVLEPQGVDFEFYLLMVFSLGFGAKPQEEGCERSEPLLGRAKRGAQRAERSGG